MNFTEFAIFDQQSARSVPSINHFTWSILRHIKFKKNFISCISVYAFSLWGKSTESSITKQTQVIIFLGRLSHELSACRRKRLENNVLKIKIFIEPCWTDEKTWVVSAQAIYLKREVNKAYTSSEVQHFYWCHERELLNCEWKQS